MSTTSKKSSKKAQVEETVNEIPQVAETAQVISAEVTKVAEKPKIKEGYQYYRISNVIADSIWDLKKDELIEEIYEDWMFDTSNTNLTFNDSIDWYNFHVKAGKEINPAKIPREGTADYIDYREFLNSKKTFEAIKDSCKLSGRGVNWVTARMVSEFMPSVKNMDKVTRAAIAGTDKELIEQGLMKPHGTRAPKTDKPASSKVDYNKFA